MLLLVLALAAVARASTPENCPEGLAFPTYLLVPAGLTPERAANWDDIYPLTNDTGEATPTDLCSQKVQQYGCQYKNACCWVAETSMCIPSNMDGIECPPIADQGDCAAAYALSSLGHA